MYRAKSTKLIIALAIIATIIALFEIHKKYPPIIAELPLVQHQNAQPKPATSVPDTLYVIPNTLYLHIPFTSQAPTANWDELHNESCEEASSIMVAEYFSGNTNTTLPAPFVEDELKKLTDWETNHFGYYLDINSEEIAQLISQVYGLQTKNIISYTEDDIKRELAQNHVIIFPANGQKLGNPNFRGSGPPYHVVVIKGYTPDRFITNDPGTRNGLNYSYSYTTLQNANGEFDHSTHSVDLSKKNIIVVWK